MVLEEVEKYIYCVFEGEIFFEERWKILLRIHLRMKEHFKNHGNYNKELFSASSSNFKSECVIN